MIFWDSSALVALLVDEADTARRLSQLQLDLHQLSFASADVRPAPAAEAEGLRII